MAVTVAVAASALEGLLKIISEHHDLINVCMVDFITKDVFSLVDESIRKDLLGLTERELCGLPLMFMKATMHQQQPKSNLESFVSKMATCHAESLGVSITRDNLLEDEGCCEGADIMSHFDRFMPEKKMHEVIAMLQTVQSLARANGSKHLVDLGSGKAYLSQVLSASGDLKVLAIDASDVNSKGAEKRSERLKKNWSSLLRRAECRKTLGVEPPSRGKHWRAKTSVGLAPDPAGESGPPEKLKIVTQFVDTETDLSTALKDQFSETIRPDFGIIGLHTCGNLASDSLRVFLADDRAKFCCNVGCCYHHLDEEFYRNPYLKDDDHRSQQNRSSFPLSKILRDKRFQLGRSARMLAAQPMDRLVAEQPVPSEALLWRAVLQVLLIQHRPEIQVSRQQVGRIAAKCTDFVSYVHKAFEKLNIALKISDGEIERTYSSLRKSHWHKLIGFYQLRAMFGPLVETLILLDRLVYLLEAEAVSRAFLVKVFDAVVSPRCYAIVAIKS